jgi:hypothetical protein
MPDWVHILPMNKTMRKIRITHAQRIWLRGVHSYFGRGLETDTRSLKVELLDKLPRQFDPAEIDPRLLRNGINLTVLGWALLDSENQLVVKSNRVIKCIREILIRNPRVKQVHVDDVSSLIAMAVDQVAVVFEKLAQIELFHDSGTKFGPVGWATINISERAFDNYLKYENIDQIIRTLVVDEFEVEGEKDASSEPERENYDVFLSYASADNREANEIYDALIAAGAKPYLSEKNLKPGDDFAEQIREALRESDELWLLLSPQSVRSEWVISEWAAAWALGKRIVPILYRCTPEQAPERIRRLQCTDFDKCRQLIAEKFRP